MQLCENCFMDLKNDGIKGCPGCAHIQYENELREKIKTLEKELIAQKQRHGLDKAEQQLFGFDCGRCDARIDSLVKGMGLTLKEFEKLESEGMIDYLNKGDKEAILESIL